MDVTFTQAGLTTTNLIDAPFPYFNFVGMKLDLVSGPDFKSASFDAAHSGEDYQGFTTVSSTPTHIDVNLAGVCGI